MFTVRNSRFGSAGRPAILHDLFQTIPLRCHHGLNRIPAVNQGPYRADFHQLRHYMQPFFAFPFDVFFP
jgi:arginine utilization protein RocB